MKPFKPLFLKTYGKQRRKVSAWLSLENRKQLFDSTPSTDDDDDDDVDVSVFEPPKPTKKRERMTSVSSRRVVHPAKIKAMLCLTEKSFDEDNKSSPSCLHKKSREKTNGSNVRAVRPSKRKNELRVTETSSDEENIRRPTPPQQKKATRKSRLVSEPGVLVRQKDRPFPLISESEEDSMSSANYRRNSVLMKTDSNDHVPSVGRFVTHRTRTAAKARLPKATFSIINSSDDFTCGIFGSSRIPQPSRRKRASPVFMVSSAENSMNVPGTVNFATNALQEISLSELTDHNLGPCPRKPIFCSTPSAAPLSKQVCLQPIPISNQSATPPSLSVSDFGVPTTFQEDLDSPGQSVPPRHPAPPSELHSEEKLHSSFGEQEPSGDLFVKAKSSNNGRSSSEEVESHSDDQDINTKNGGESPSLNLLSSDDIISSSQFLSVAGELEWLIEALKEKCLTVRCTVQLERLETVTQLCSQTTYSSCLGHLSPGYSHQTSEQKLCEDSIQTIGLSQFSEPSLNFHLSVTNSETSGFLQSVNTPKHAVFVSNSQSSNISPLSSFKVTEQSASEMHLDFAHTDGSNEFIMDTQLPANSPVKPLVTQEKDAAIKNKCTIQFQKWAPIQMNAQQLKGFMEYKEAGLTCNKTSSNPDKNRPDINDTPNTVGPEDLKCSAEITESIMASNGQPINSSPVTETHSVDLEMEEEVARLKKRCLTDKPIVGIKRLTVSQLKVLNLRNRKHHHHSESDTNRSNVNTSVTNVGLKKRGSYSSEETISSDKKDVLKNSCNIPHKRKKASLAPKVKKSRSTSTDRPGTTRKACVSGLSVSRWKNKDDASMHMFGSRTAQVSGKKDCSISELISPKENCPRELLGTSMNFSTPLRVSRLNLSSLLADFTPNTHTWRRLKAALSVHRKGKVLHTPRGVNPLVMQTPGRPDLADVSQDLFATPFRTSLPKGLRSQLDNCGDSDLSDAEKVCAECGQQRPLPWEECIFLHRMKQCVKIGEGTFGEVFSSTNASGETVALKIIPVEGSEQVNGEDQKTFGEVLHEIIISKELSSLKEKQQNQTHGFIGLNDLHCVQGCYPPDFLNAWDTFDQQKGSENDRPDFFEDNQLFIILEFEFGGIDLENSNGTLTSLGVAKSILHQVTASLAVAEQELHFEHRDLHWGNVLVKPTKQKKANFLLNGAVHSLETKGVLVRIIDYSLSRLEIDDLTVSCDISKDKELFMGQGDYQFDIYRLMRQENGNNWSNYQPHTNVLWLHYLCSKLLSMKYRGKGRRGAKDMREALTCFYDNVLQYSSATEVLHNCPMFQ